jgi:hypothetical protein
VPCIRLRARSRATSAPANIACAEAKPIIVPLSAPVNPSGVLELATRNANATLRSCHRQHGRACAPARRSVQPQSFRPRLPEKIPCESCPLVAR